MTSRTHHVSYITGTQCIRSNCHLFRAPSPTHKGRIGQEDVRQALPAGGWNHDLVTRHPLAGKRNDIHIILHGGNIRGSTQAWWTHVLDKSHVGWVHSTRRHGGNLRDRIHRRLAHGRGCRQLHRWWSGRRLRWRRRNRS